MSHTSTETASLKLIFTKFACSVKKTSVRRAGAHRRKTPVMSSSSTNLMICTETRDKEAPDSWPCTKCNNDTRAIAVQTWCPAVYLDAVASRGSGARAPKLHETFCNVHRMTRNNTLDKVNVAVTELYRSCCRRIRIMFGEATAQSPCQTSSSS